MDLSLLQKTSRFTIVLTLLIPLAAKGQINRQPLSSPFDERFQRVLDITLSDRIKLVLPVIIPGKSKQPALLALVEGLDKTDYKRTLQVLKLNGAKFTVGAEVPLLGNYPDCLLAVSSTVLQPLIVPGKPPAASSAKLLPAKSGWRR